MSCVFRRKRAFYALKKNNLGKCFDFWISLFCVFNFAAVMYCGAGVTRLVPYLPSKWELRWSFSPCCIFHLRDFHCCNNHTISAFCQEPGQAELIMFVLARFLAHWTTAIVLNSVPPLMEHTHFLALTQGIKFFGTGLPLRSPSESIKRNRDWMEKWRCDVPYAARSEYHSSFDISTALCNWVQDVSPSSPSDSVVDLSRLFKNVLVAPF